MSPDNRTDDLGHHAPWPSPAGRVVSLVPSITEALASVRPEAVVGATEWCTRPADLDVARVRGTKNPDLAAIRELSPDLVIANKEENREVDVRRLRERDVKVWVTEITTVPGAIDSLERLFTIGLGWPTPTWLTDARAEWCGPVPPVTRGVVIPIWRDPWMVVGSNTFTDDLVRRLGYQNLWSHPQHNPEGQRYPHVDLATIDSAGADLVLLPDEPYVFSAADGPDAFTLTPTRLVNGRLLTWYGPSLLQARDALARPCPS